MPVESVLALALGACCCSFTSSPPSAPRPRNMAAPGTPAPATRHCRRQTMVGRLTRAQANFAETFPIAIVALIGVVVAGRTSEWTAIGGWIWLGARLVYLPLYAMGVPGYRDRRLDDQHGRPRAWCYGRCCSAEPPGGVTKWASVGVSQRGPSRLQASSHGRTRIIVFPGCRLVGLKAATASSSVATVPMFVRSRPSRTRWIISPSWARSNSTTK